MDTPTPAAVDQFDLFPERISVDRVDTRSAGTQARLTALFVVKYEREAGAHQVFHDRHGWYCAEHGRECRAVTAARSRRRA